MIKRLASWLVSPVLDPAVSRRAILMRGQSADDGTPGVLVADNGFTCKTLELPWRDNRVKRSCVPPGVYLCRVVNSPRFGRVYGLVAVPGRSAVLIHGGNLAGDVEKGLLSHVQGCVLLGVRHGRMSGQRAVLLSKPTVAKFMKAMNNEPFYLDIREAA